MTNTPLKTSDPELFNILFNEVVREDTTLELIASENFVSYPVLEMAGGIMTNKYAEGYPGKRYYGGCEFVDQAENLAKDRANRLFGVEYSNVQPHSGSQANMAVLMTFVKPGDTILGLDLAHGGHLTHGSKVNFSGKLYNSIFYQVDKDTGLVNFDEVIKLAREHKPKLIICGGSAYPRFIEFQDFKQIADDVGAYLMADIAHPSGLVAAGIHPSPVPFCNVITTTTHKTLRGPRGGMIMMGKDDLNPWDIVAPKSGRVKSISELLDNSVMPGVQGGPLMHIIAAKAVAFGEALRPEFKVYAQQIIDNAKTMADEFITRDYQLVSGGTDTHVILIDLTNKDITGKAAEKSLENAGITVNKNMIPFDEKSPFITSGIRIGTPAITTRGMQRDDMKKIVSLIDTVIKYPNDDQKISSVKAKVKELCKSFPLYPELRDQN
ncbi:MAG: serine hydroxymethyltransferase [Candidatus Neomarinimicrobiota bacterium]|nr:serine hydroxymethyltransferase [Candidatus Neomarinimicrobiota bacterium]